jgi:gluconolactonase
MDAAMLTLALLGSGLVQQADEAFRKLVPLGAKVEQLATGFQFTEGPTWDGESRLYFSDIPADTIFRVDLAGQATTFLKPSGKSNGLMFDRDGTLLACRHWERNVARITPEGKVTVVADAYEGKRLNSPNDLIIASDEAIYFTDPHYGLEGRPQEQDCEAVYRIAPDGKLTRVIDDMTRPNGIFISPDRRTLYVADSERRAIRAYDLRPDGSAANGRDFADLRHEGPGVPDGMTLDSEGNVYCTNGGVWVLSPEGKHLGTIEVPEVSANCTFGGPDNRDLFITASKSIYRIRLNAKGLR